MESQNPPSKIARHAHNSGDCEKMNSNGPPPIQLNLELGCGSGHRESGTKCFRFTYVQLQELQHQALIYRYMEAGLPVPYHLVYPIWKSVATSSVAGLNGQPYHQHYPSLLGYRALNLEYRKGMDPEPGRCRRTDGKKWRCSKEAVQDHKYCERHMHRGRQRSTNHVEPSQRSAAPINSNTNRSISLSQ